MAEVGSARKRREANGAGADGHSPVKKLKLEDDEPPEANPNTLEAVRRKNKEMALDLLEKNRRLVFLARKCESLFRQCAVSQRAFRCIQRQWLQLVDDVASAGAAVTVENMDAWRDVVGKTDSLGVLRLPAEAVAVALPEWFVAISRGDNVELKEAGDGDDDDDGGAGDDHVELETKSEMLNETEKQLQQALEGERQRVSELLQSIFAAVANGANQQLEFKELVDQKRTATAHVLELKDDLDAMKRKLADMQSDLEAKEVERHRACRAYDRLKDFVEKQGTAVAATADESANGEKFENGNAPGGGGGEGQDAGQDAKAPQRAGEKRVTLVDPEVNKPSADREAVQRLQNDIGILVQKLKEERAKVEVMRTELTHLRAFETAAKQEDARTKQEFDAAVSRLREEKAQLEEQLAAARALDSDHRAQVETKWKAHLDKIKDDAAKTKAKLNDLAFKNTALREKLTSLSVYRDQLNDLKAEHESLKREADALRQQLEREKLRAERVEQVAESKQNVELREKLAAVEEERDVLQGSVAALTSSLEKPGDVKLADALRRESDALKKWEELQAEVSELRAATETARAELEMANANQDAFKDENDALVAEIKALGKELEATRYSKKKMVKQLEEKRQSAQKLRSELAKEADARSHATEELATVRLQVGSLKYVHSQQKAALEAAKELQKTTEHELVELKRALETVQCERDALGAEKVKAERDAEVAQQMYKAEAVHKQRQVLQDKSRPCDKCDAYRKKEAEYEKRLAALRTAAGTLSTETGGSGGSGGGGLSELERFELQDLRKQLKCSVCQDRHKNVIISKCSHLFCKECIDSNLRSRNRKCPTCKKMFGQDDVKSVWFT